MKTLFDKTVINGMDIENRIVRSATWEGMCEVDGRPTEKLIECYKNLAAGDLGLIISGFTFISREGKQLLGKMGIYDDRFENEYKKMTSAVHKNKGKIAIQLVHAGGQTDTKTAGRQPLAPSAVKVEQFSETPAELTTEEIARLITAFGDNALRAKKWGFDAIQLHGAHGYLINQFLSPLTNRRIDKYGGSIENRARFLFEAYHQVREAVGNDYPVMIKLNISDNLAGGFEEKDGIYVAKKLSQEGIDAIEVSSGTRASGAMSPVREKINKPEKEAYNLDLALAVKKAASCPIILVGGFRSLEVAEKAITDGMDYISMARPLIREPNLAKRWKQGDTSPAACISCNKCFTAGIKKGGIYCMAERKK